VSLGEDMPRDPPRPTEPLGRAERATALAVGMASGGGGAYAVFASATQRIGLWALSASYAHAFKSPGNPAMLSVNDPVLAPLATLQGNLFSNDATQYAIGARYYFSDWASWYIVGSQLNQGPGAHYCLGASGHGYQVCSRDQFNNTIGGATIRAATTGMTFNF